MSYPASIRNSFRSRESHAQAAVSLTAFLAIVGAFGKSFIPFQFFGSSEIVVGALFLVLFGVALDPGIYWSRLIALKHQLFLIGAFFCLSALSFAILSNGVPTTYLIGMIVFQSLFLMLGIVASRRFSLVASVLFAMGAVYFLYCAAFLLEHESFYPNGHFGDVFSFGMYRLDASHTQLSQLYQNVGVFLGLGALSFLYVSRGWNADLRIAGAVAACGLCGILIIAVEARGAFFALIFALLLLSKGMREFIVLLITVLLIAVILFFVLGEWLNGLPVWQRTLNEVELARPLTRVAIMRDLADAIGKNPSMLWFGRGLGMFPIDFTGLAPDWIGGNATVTLYPHNPLVEALYELGVLGFAIVSLVLATPFITAISAGFAASRFPLSFYTYFLTIEMVSGSLAYSYLFYFVYGVVIGAIVGCFKGDCEQQVTRGAV